LRKAPWRRSPVEPNGQTEGEVTKLKLDLLEARLIGASWSPRLNQKCVSPRFGRENRSSGANIAGDLTNLSGAARDRNWRTVVEQGCGLN
jgi:hypothetical protein